MYDTYLLTYLLTVADARFAIAKFLLTIGRLLLHCWYSLGRPVTIGTPMVIFAVLTVLWLFSVHCWYTIGTVLGRHVTTGTPMVNFCAVLTVFWLFLAVFGTVLVDLWRLVHQWSFFLFWPSFDCLWLFFTIGAPLVHCWYSLDRPVTIGTQMVLSVFDDWYSVRIVTCQRL